jgi:GNAT superfamily N-acetyltransferase
VRSYPTGMSIRPLTPADAPLLDQILEGMSPTSRYRRFHGAKPRLTSAERRYLAAADGRNHLGLLAFSADGEPIAVARAVRLPDDPTAAELAVSVIDEHHRQGIGMTLVRRLARDARNVGIDRLVAVVLSDNWLSAMLERKGFEVRRRPGLTNVLELDVRRSALLVQRPVELVRPRPRQLGDHARRHPRLRAAVDQPAHGGQG